MDILRGYKTPAWVVGLFRAIVEAALIAGLGALLVWMETASPAELAPYAPVVFGLIRLAEGIIDGIDPAKQRAIQRHKYQDTI